MHRDVLRLCVLTCLIVAALAASEYQGQVTFNGLPVPGATVTATEAGKSFGVISDAQGVYSFPDLADGPWTVAIEMTGFATLQQQVEVSPNARATPWELKLLALDQVKAEMKRFEESAPAPAPPPEAPPKQAEAPANVDQSDAADGLLINGSTNNGAASPFAQLAAFGNNRNGANNLYTGGIGIILDNSALDARSFSLTGQDTPKPTYSRLTGIATLGGPIRMPRLWKAPPYFFAAYQWTRNNNATTQSALVPDAAERNSIPASLISPQARALLYFYPLPNVSNDARYNFQIPIVSPTHQDALQSRFNKTIDSRNQIYGRFAFQDTRTDNPNLFRFLDTTDVLGINTAANWAHRFGQRWFLNLGVQYSRLATRVKSNFEDREDVSRVAGIMGNDPSAMNWGPPTLNFTSGIAGLIDATASFNRNQTTGFSDSVLWSHGGHNDTFGTDFRRQEFNYLSQQNPRGTFTFTGAATGSDFGDFLQGIPDVSSIAFGNADKYFRESIYDAFCNDDWRITPEFSLNTGLRWEYGAPITELYGRLANLDVAPDFTAATPIVARTYSGSLLHPDRRGVEPRVGIAWRPMSGSSMVVRAGYGVYYDTSVYQTIAVQMAQQPPLSKTFNVQNSAADPLTLANGFNAPSVNTFGIDPNFRVGYAQNWQVSLQRDLPGSLQMTATYLGIKGTRGPQEFLPNTYPTGAANPCPSCPAGFAYMTSNGNSSREAAQLQLRRRLHNGFTASLQYTFSKSIDDDAVLGGQGATASPMLAIAQNWLDLAAERSLSTFDQRHLLTAQAQYTTGLGMTGGTLLSGWRGALVKEWIVSTQITGGSGLPETPVYLAPVEGTGFTGTIRASYTGAPLYSAPSGLFLNPAAYTAPLSGQWGNAGRDSITGPAQFTLNASLGRVFRVSDRLNLDLRFDSTNALNHVTFTTWDTTVNNAQFGLPAAANAMRSMQVTMRLRF